MGKLKQRPAGYSPFLELVFRQRKEGGGVLEPGRFAGATDAKSRRTCLVMVHGFNNNDGEAAAAYDGFRQRQLDEFGPSTDIVSLNRRLGDAFWTGDADWGWFDLVDFGVYSQAVGFARRTGAELRDLILELPNLLEIDFIGHSLGCRLILETLEMFREHDDGPAIRRVCLMAAAVPMEMLEPGGRYHDLLADLSARGTRVLILHSRQDTVLQYAFSLGQATAGPGERSTRALGREGPNPMIPGYRATVDEVQMAGANHGDYWGHSSKDVARESARNAGRFLEIGTSGREVGSSRSVGVSAPGFPYREPFSPLS